MTVPADSGVIVDVDALQQFDVAIQGALEFRAYGVALGHGKGPFDGDGQVDGDIRAKTVGLHFLDGQDAGRSEGYGLDLLLQFGRGDGVHQVFRGIAQDPDPRPEDDDGHQGPGQGVEPGQPGAGQEDAHAGRGRGEHVVPVVEGQGPDREVAGLFAYPARLQAQQYLQAHGEKGRRSGPPGRP